MSLVNMLAKWLFPASLLFAACLLLAGCCHSTGGDWREYKVFCGMTYHNGTVSEAEWQQFCDEYVTTEFPDGYTALAATGYWRQEDTAAAKREDAHIIMILASSDAKEKVRRIAQQYRELFHQESVLVTTSPADAEFVEAASD